MLVCDYIDAKDNHGVRTLSTAEAVFFGEKWPLKHGWFMRIGQKELSHAEVLELENMLRLAGLKKRYRRGAVKSLAALAKCNVCH